jgi:hypothetical protein
VQPGHQNRSGRVAADGLGGLADGIDLVGVEGLEELLASGEAIDTSASGSANAVRAAIRILSRLRSASARLTGAGN